MISTEIISIRITHIIFGIRHHVVGIIERPLENVD